MLVYLLLKELHRNHLLVPVFLYLHFCCVVGLHFSSNVACGSYYRDNARIPYWLFKGCYENFLICFQNTVLLIKNVVVVKNFFLRHVHYFAFLKSSPGSSQVQDLYHLILLSGIRYYTLWQICFQVDHWIISNIQFHKLHYNLAVDVSIKAKFVWYILHRKV